MSKVFGASSPLQSMQFTRGFLLPLVPAIAGGALWDATGLPLGWLMGSAVVIGGLAISGVKVSAPKPWQYLSHAIIGASVGLSLSPDAATELISWAPMMLLAAVLGVLLAIAATPLMARAGGVSPATAFYSLLPGGIIEMANIGERHGADRTTIAALHAVRVGLIVSLLPLSLFAFSQSGIGLEPELVQITPPMLALVLATALLAGAGAQRLGVPAPFLLGSIIAVALCSALQVFQGAIPQLLLNIAQLILGFALGAKFQRQALGAIPRAVVVAMLLLSLIIAVMALAGYLASWVIPESVSTLLLCFSIGGMAEMIITGKALGQNAAMIAAFQVVRAVLVNSLAGAIWSRIGGSSIFTPNSNS